ncbi:MAG: hypothetical protein E2O39_05725 [Planctomycetota bacterium]|nr:MAG: hypothetical protein E2O39_05725 [Planctomycetota bacterium]
MLAPVLALGLSAGAASPQAADVLRGAPLHYDAPATAGLVERVGRRLESGDLKLAFDPDAGYLPALLDALEIPVSTQILVFSKTSFQSERISPAAPRAIFFGDAAYVGSIPGAPLVEITSIDPERGPVFYTLEQDAERAPRFVRRHDECLQCHAISHTYGWPGNLVRSVHPDRTGRPILSSGTELVTHATPFEKRWGGWYVTGTHGDARHRGNAIADVETEMVDPEAGANIEDLAQYFDTDRYLSPHSDIVALMVFEHQAEMQNRIARAGYEVRIALYRQAEVNRIFGDPPGTLRGSTARILKSQAKKLLETMLLETEIRLPAPIVGTSGFAAEFTARGRCDERGRSLRDLDLAERLFRYPCSYLVHSPEFDELPAELLEVVYRDLWTILSTAADGGEPARLAAPDRTAILEILLATKDGLPAYWRS